MQKIIILIVSIFVSFYSYSQNAPKEFQTECFIKNIEENIENKNLNQGCSNLSGYFYDNYKYLPDINDNMIYLKVNFIFLTKPDGTGNFEENNPEHMSDIDGIISVANQLLSNLINEEDCLPDGYIENTKMQIIVNKIWKVDPNWDFLESGYIPGNMNSANCALCPPNYNGNYFYNYIDDDPTIPEGINIVFANNGNIYNDMIANENYDNYHNNLPIEKWAMSQFPTTNDLSRTSRVFYPDMFNKYMWMKNVATITYNRPWSTIRHWFRGSGKGLIHELGHSLWLYHDYSCDENIMHQGFPTGRILKKNQIGKMYRAASITNVRKYFTTNSNKNNYININQNEEWDLNFRLYSDIIVENSQLSLSCELITPYDSKIIVKNNSQLVIRGAKLNSSNNLTWEGIKIEGNGYTMIEPGTLIDNGYFYAYTDNSSNYRFANYNINYDNIYLDSNKDEKEIDLKIYPNPFKNDIKIYSKTLKKSEIRVIIFDKYGLTVYNKSCNFINDIDVKLTHLKKGVYFMKIVFEDGTSKTKTIIKQ